MAGGSSSDSIIAFCLPIESNEPTCKVPKERSTFSSTVTFTLCISLFRYTQPTCHGLNYESYKFRVWISPILLKLKLVQLVGRLVVLHDPNSLNVRLQKLNSNYLGT